jgi:hypothetical protein
VDDDGNQTYTIELAAAISTDGDYSGMVGDDVDVTNEDNDPVIMGGITVNPTSGLVVPDFSNDVFSIVLDSQPTNDVTINLTVTVGADTVFLSTLSVVFTTLDWETPQDVFVISNVDGDSMNDPITVDLLPATSLDMAYNNLDGGQVTGMEVDSGI